MRRHPAWRKRLELLIDSIEREPFDWGAADCGPNWAGKAVEAVLGIDPAEAFRGRYASPEGALRVMRQAGVDNLGDLVRQLLLDATGEDCEIRPGAARLGDLAGIADDSRFGFSLGIVNGERILVRRPDGKGTVDLLLAARAWRLGDRA